MGTVTVWIPRLPGAANDPASVTATFTANGAVGAGLAVTVNDTDSPSVTAEPALTLTNGSDAVPSSLTIPTEADPEAESRPPPSPDACI